MDPHGSVNKGEAELVSYSNAVTYNFNLESHQRSERVHAMNKPAIAYDVVTHTEDKSASGILSWFSKYFFRRTIFNLPDVLMHDLSIRGSLC